MLLEKLRLSVRTYRDQSSSGLAVYQNLQLLLFLPLLGLLQLEQLLACHLVLVIRHVLSQDTTIQKRKVFHYSAQTFDFGIDRVG